MHSLIDYSLLSMSIRKEVSCSVTGPWIELRSIVECLVEWLLPKRRVFYDVVENRSGSHDNDIRYVDQAIVRWAFHLYIFQSRDSSMQWWEHGTFDLAMLCHCLDLQQPFDLDTIPTNDTKTASTATSATSATATATATEVPVHNAAAAAAAHHAPTTNHILLFLMPRINHLIRLGFIVETPFPAGSNARAFRFSPHHFVYYHLNVLQNIHRSLVAVIRDPIQSLRIFCVSPACKRMACPESRVGRPFDTFQGMTYEHYCTNGQNEWDPIPRSYKPTQQEQDLLVHIETLLQRLYNWIPHLPTLPSMDK